MRKVGGLLAWLIQRSRIYCSVKYHIIGLWFVAIFKELAYGGQRDLAGAIDFTANRTLAGLIAFTRGVRGLPP